MLDSEYRLTARCWRWLRRFRHRRGYGVHSPYAFRFITDVVYQESPYYAYATIHERLTTANWYAMRYDAESGISEKDLRLLFRLANFCQPRQIRLHGSRDTVENCLRLAVPLAFASAKTPDFAHADSGTHEGRHGDNLPSKTDVSRARIYIYVEDARNCPPPPPTFPAGSMMVVRGIHRNAEAEARWKVLKESEKVTLTFDLGRFGVALSVEKMVKQDYIVCYF